jgi:hypothetical protein
MIFEEGVSPMHIKHTIALSAALLGSSIASQAIADQENWVHVSKNGAQLNGSRGDVPYDAIVGGHEGYGPPGAPPFPLYICEASLPSTEAPGKVRPGLPGCTVSFAGSAPFVPDYKVLVPGWRSAYNGDPSVYQFAAHLGAFDIGGPGFQDLYFCRVHFSDSLQIGKIRPGFGGCVFSYGGKAMVRSDYEVLVNPGTFEHFPIRADVGYHAFRGAPAYIPPDALVGGFDTNGENEYLCIGYDDPSNSDGKGKHPGKIESGWGGCTVAFGNDEYSWPYYDIIRPDWQNNSIVGSNRRWTFQAGTDVDSKPLYICQTEDPLLGVTPGKARQDRQACYYGWGGSAENPGTEFSYWWYNVLSE